MRALLPVLATTLACQGLPPDVVFITIDTLRVDHVGAFAADSPAKTPHMDALAGDGVRFDDAYSPISVTGPAFTTLLTGREIGSHKVAVNMFRGGQGLDRSVETLAERYRAEGYQTGAFLSGFTLRRNLGLARGFQRYDAPTKERRRLGAKTVGRALQWMSGLKADERMLLWYHSYDPHGPLGVWGPRLVEPEAPEDPSAWARLPEYQRFANQSDPAVYAARYAKAVEYADAQVGTLIEWLKAEGRYEGAVIVLTADHGESFTERSLWFDHGTHASEEQLHVPLIIKLPGGAQAGARRSGLVGLADVAPTVWAASGMRFPLHKADGLNLLQPDATGRSSLVGESSHCKEIPSLQCAPQGPAGKELSWRDGKTTVIRRSGRDGVDLRSYDVATDPGELGPGSPQVADETAGRLERMVQVREQMGIQSRWEAAAADRRKREAAGEIEDPETRMLRELGYLEGSSAAPASVEEVQQGGEQEQVPE